MNHGFFLFFDRDFSFAQVLNELSEVCEVFSLVPRFPWLFSFSGENLSAGLENPIEKRCPLTADAAST
jgi:hypothetical protein